MVGILGKRRQQNFLLLLIFAAFVVFQSNQNEGDFNNNQHLRSLSERPVIHTFFHSRGKVEEAVLQVWKREWSNYGFETKVLTIEDAKKHPDFEKVESIMEPLHTKMGYDALCFYRWFAMAASGGGWMSDHDTFPIFH